MPDILLSDKKVFLLCAFSTTPLFCDATGRLFSSQSTGWIDEITQVRVSVSKTDSAGVAEDHWVSAPHEIDVSVVQVQLAKLLDAITSSLEKRIENLQAVDDDVNAGMLFQQEARFYRTKDLSFLLRNTQSEIGRALQDPSLQSLHDHVDTSFEKISLPDEKVTSKSAAEEIINHVKMLLKQLTSASQDLAVDLVFVTDPVETNGTALTLKPCEKCPTLVSEGGMHRLFRGRYNVYATKKDYQSFSGVIDLVDDPGTLLHCKLARSSPRGNETSECLLEER